LTHSQYNPGLAACSPFAYRLSCRERQNLKSANDRLETICKNETWVAELTDYTETVNEAPSRANGKGKHVARTRVKRFSGRHKVRLGRKGNWEAAMPTVS
jgi:hypothetical protein